jgi:hypothetical protein
MFPDHGHSYLTQNKLFSYFLKKIKREGGRKEGRKKEKRRERKKNMSARKFTETNLLQETKLGYKG